MTPQVKSFLKTKLAETCHHLNEVETNKKQAVAGYNEEIKGTKRNIKAFSEAIKEGNVDVLYHILNPEYVDSLLDYAQKHPQAEEA